MLNVKKNNRKKGKKINKENKGEEQKEGTKKLRSNTQPTYLHKPTAHTHTGVLAAG